VPSKLSTEVLLNNKPPLRLLLPPLWSLDPVTLLITLEV
jgi:hypothetical protein